MNQESTTAENGSSEEARVIDSAHKMLRDAIGTPYESLARQYLEQIVKTVKERAK